MDSDVLDIDGLGGRIQLLAAAVLSWDAALGLAACRGVMLSDPGLHPLTLVAQSTLDAVMGQKHVSIQIDPFGA